MSICSDSKGEACAAAVSELIITADVGVAAALLLLLIDLFLVPGKAVPGCREDKDKDCQGPDADLNRPAAARLARASGTNHPS